MVHPSDPSWWSKAERAVLAFKTVTHRARGAQHAVYVILLHDPRRSDPWGLYVGQAGSADSSRHSP